MFQPRSGTNKDLVSVTYCYVLDYLVPPHPILSTVWYQGLGWAYPDAHPLPCPWPTPPRLGFIYPHGRRTVLAVRPPPALLLPSFCRPTPIPIPFFVPPHDASSSVFYISSSIIPCTHHGHIFLPTPLYLVSHTQTSRSLHSATHCTTFTFRLPMYLSNNWIPAVCMNYSATGISHGLLACHISRFPVFWGRNPTWVPSTALTITYNRYQDSYPKISTACIIYL